jgi:predicted dehydrogenase
VAVRPGAARVREGLPRSFHQIEVEDTAVAVLEFENGALGTLEAATSAFPGYSRRIELTGSNGTVILDGDTLAAVDLQDATEARSQVRLKPDTTYQTRRARP